MSSSSLVKTTDSNPPPDCFDEPSDGSSAGARFAKFDAAIPQKMWTERGGDAAYLGPYIAANCLQENLKWFDKRVVDRTTQTPGVTLPDADDLNNAIPMADWEEDPFTGKAKGPWVRNYTVHLVDPQTGSKVISSNSTAGQRQAWTELKEATSFMRKMRGALVYPVVMLASASFPTKWGMKQRPHFEIKEWRDFGSSSTPAIAGPVPGKPVAPLTSAEIINDSIDDLITPAAGRLGAIERAPWDDGLPDAL
jgi:hypothetical protein